MLGVGYLAIEHQRYREALQWLDEGLSASDDCGGQRVRYFIRANQGLASLWLGELADAARALDEALELCHEAGGEEVVEEVLLATAALAAAESELRGRRGWRAQPSDTRPACTLRASSWSWTG